MCEIINASAFLRIRLVKDEEIFMRKFFLLELTDNTCYLFFNCNWRKKYVKIIRKIEKLKKENSW